MKKLENIDKFGLSIFGLAILFSTTTISACFILKHTNSFYIQAFGMFLTIAFPPSVLEYIFYRMDKKAKEEIDNVSRETLKG